MHSLYLAGAAVMAKDYRIVDRGLEAVIAADHALNHRGVAVGIQSDAGKEDDGTTILDVAIYNEFGTETIPSRPFLRGSFDANKDEAARTMEHLLHKAEKGASATVVLNTLGQWYEAKVKHYTRGGTQYFKPNAPGTIKRKGSEVPLIDTGKMINAIRYALVEG